MKIIISLLIALFVSVNLFAGPLTEVSPDHWSYKAISNFIGKGIIKGTWTKTFAVGKNISRYEMPMIIGKLICGEEVGVTLDFEDLAMLEKLAVEFSDEFALFGIQVIKSTVDYEELKPKPNDKNLEASNLDLKKGRIGNLTIRGSYDKVRFSKPGFSKFDYRSGTIGDDLHSKGFGLCYFYNLDENASDYAKDLIPGSSDQKTWLEQLYFQENNYVDIDERWKSIDLRLVIKKVNLEFKIHERSRHNLKNRQRVNQYENIEIDRRWKICELNPCVQEGVHGTSLK